MVVPRCGRTGEVVEPMLTDQWFVDDDEAGAGDASVLPGQVDPGPVPRGGRATRACPRARRARARPCRFVPGEWLVDVPALDQQHPGLVHLAPALVGPPDPGVVRRRGQRLRRAQRSRRARAGAREARPRAGVVRRATRTCSTPGSARRCGATRRSAGPSETPELAHVPAVVGAGHRLRHHLLLGRAHDHDDDLLHRPRAVPRRVHQRDRARRGRPEDVEVEGQRARPARPDRRRRRRDARRQAHQQHDGPAAGRVDREAHAQAVPERHSGVRRRRAALHVRERSRRSTARSTSTSTAARATATSATSCGTRRASC